MTQPEPREWTPHEFQEPWHVSDGGPTGLVIKNCELRPVAIDVRGDRACRIVAAVNACSPFADPERDVAEMREALRDVCDIADHYIPHGLKGETGGPARARADEATIERARAVLARTAGDSWAQLVSDAAEGDPGEQAEVDGTAYPPGQDPRNRRKP